MKVRVSTPPTTQEKEALQPIMKAFLQWLPKDVRDGFKLAWIDEIAATLEHDYDRVWSLENLQAVWSQSTAQAPAPRKTAEQLSKPQGGDRVTGRVNHAHKNDAPVPLSDDKAKQAIMVKLTLLQKSGHHGLVRELNSNVKQQMSEGKGWERFSKPRTRALPVF